MSEKLTIQMDDIGALDTMSNPVLLNGKGARMLQNIGDLDGDGKLRTQPGVAKVLGAPILADYTTGTVAVSNGSKAVTGSSTAWLTNAYAGDIFIGPDGVKYVVDAVTSATAITLRTPYQGTTASGAAYTVRHRVWMMAPFYAASGRTNTSVTQSYISTTAGTLSGCTATASGIALTKTVGGYLQYAGNPVQFSVGSVHNLVASQFTVSSNLTVSGVHIELLAQSLGAGSNETTATYKVTVQTNSASNLPSGTLMHANATTGNITYGAQVARVASSGIPATWQAFGGAITLVAGTKYWLVVEKVSTWTNAKLIVSTEPATSLTSSGYTVASTTSYYTVIAGGASTAGYVIRFDFCKYPTTGTNTYVTASFDMGATPVADGTLTIQRAYSIPSIGTSGTATNFLTTAFANAENSSDSTLTYLLEGSADNSAWNTVIAAGATALTNTIPTTYYRYYRITFTLSSTAGRSTPLIAGASILFPSTVDEATESNSFQVVGCGPNIYTQVKAGAATISTTAVPSGIEVRPIQYQQYLIWSTGGQAPRYWDGVAAADAAVSAMVKSDASAGTDPPVRADGMCLHNDKAMVYGNVGIQYFTGTSTGQTDTVTTDSGATFTTTGTGMVRWRLYPDVTNWPLKWWVITTNNGTSATSAGAKMNSAYGTNSPAASGDTYLITRNYPKALWYTTETEPADWPTTSFLKFGESDGDTIQTVISWKGRLIVVCKNQVWRVVGYGPSTPWEKDILMKNGGTLSPRSVVANEDSMYWWDTSGIVQFQGGFGGTTDISNNIRDIVGDLNETMRDHITGIVFQGKCFWSFPTADSNVNNRTIIYNPGNNRWTVRTFGFYAPAVLVGEDQEEVLYFQDAESGCICKYDETQPALTTGAPNVIFRSQFAAASSPIDLAQWLYLKAIVRASTTETVNVGYAYDYGDTYAPAGSLEPVDTAVSGRTSVNATDKVYICRFPNTVRGTSISVELSFAPSDFVDVEYLELTSDPLESETLK